MKVLLINPAWGRYISRAGGKINRAWPPLDLINLAAMLPGHDVTLTDARAKPQSSDAIAATVRGYDWVVITSSPLDRWQCPNIEIELFLDQLTKIDHPRVILTGVHGTQFPEHFLRRSRLFAVVRGEPERAAAALILGARREDVPGTAWLDGSTMRLTPATPLNDFSFPIPAFELLNPDSYYYELMGRRFFLLETTRGCPFPCTFCQRDLYGGRTYRYKKPEQVAAEVQAALSAGMRCGYFMDLEFSANRAFAIKICDAIRPFGKRWRWCIQTRADSIDPELLAAMRASGCRLIHIGVETGSPALLAKTNKDVTLERIAAGVAMVKKAGLQVACFFMCGLPEETEMDREATLEFAKSIDANYVSFNIANPYPGTPLYAQRAGPELYPESIFQGPSLEEIRRWKKSAYRRYYLRLPYMVSRLRSSGLGQLPRQARLFSQTLLS